MEREAKRELLFSSALFPPAPPDERLIQEGHLKGGDASELFRPHSSTERAGWRETRRERERDRMREREVKKNSSSKYLCSSISSAVL